MQRKLLTVMAWLLAGTSLATDFYVSSHRSGRSDNNAGTSPTAPWASFGKVVSAWGGTIKAGDTVHLERGSVLDYSLSTDWVLPIGGNATAGPITVRGDTYGTGAKPVVRRSGGATQAVCFWIRVGGYVTLRDFVFDGGSVQGRNSVPVLIGGSGLPADVRNVQILNMTLQNLAASSSYYISGIYLAGWNGYAVRDCLIEGNSISGYNAHGINHYPQKTVAGSQSRIINATYRNNHIFGARENYGNIGSGIHIGYGGSGNLFEYNLVEGPHYGGSIMTMNCAGNETGLILRHNVVTGNTMQCGIMFAYDGNGAPGTVGMEMYGNVVAGSRNPGIWIWTMGYVTGLVNIYNNTLYDNNRVGTVSWQTGGQLLVDGTSSKVNLNIRNNLLVSGAANTAGLFVRSGYTGALAHNNNLYWHTGGTGNTAVNNKGTVFSVANVLNFEPSARNTNPQFTSANSWPTSLSSTGGATPEGLMPQSGSPAVAAGAALGSAYASALNVVTRPQGAGWDIGAYERPGSTTTPPPAQPTGLAATAVSASRIDLSWNDNATDETGYQVERSTDGANFTLVATLGAGAKTYSNTGLAASTTYHFRVRAMRDTTPSAYSNTAQATTQALPPPAHPTGLAATTVSASRIDLNWTDNAADETGYQVERGTDGVLFTMVATLAAGAQTYADTGLAAETTYHYRVRAMRDTTPSDYSNPAEATTQGTPPSAPPTGLAAAAVSVSRIDLSWNDNADNETAYEVERSADGAVFALVATLPASSTTYSDIGLALETTYHYRVRAMRGTTPSDYSNTAQATTQAQPDTTPPEIVAAAAAGDASRVIVTFSEPVEAATASDPANYSLPGLYTVRTVVHSKDVVTLSVAPAFSHQTQYTLQVANVRDLSGNPVAAGTSATFTFLAVDPAMVAWYTFEGDLLDRSSNGNHASAAAGTTFDDDGRLGRALRFNDPGSFLETPFQAMNPTQGSVALWVNPAEFVATGPQYIFGHSAPSAWGDRIQLYTDLSPGQLNMGLGNEHFRRVNIAVLTLQQWTHLALTWEQGTYRVYVDGFLAADGTYSGLNTIHATADVGNDGRATLRGDAFRGRVDDVRYYSRAISSAEVALLANPVVVPEPPPTMQVQP